MATFTGTIFHALVASLEGTVDDKTDGYESGLDLTKWMKTRGMDSAYDDILETGGPGLASEVAEGEEIPTGEIREGYITRFRARKFGLRLVITEEAMDDNKYPEVINAAGRLKRALFKTADVDSALMLVRAESTSFPGGDGLPLASASHTLPAGGTFSNTMATPMTPSRLAVIVARSAVKKMPGHDGVTEGYDLKKVVCPTEQWAVWEGIVGSDKAPEPGAFNEINVVKKMGLDVVPLKFWDNTTTNYAFITDANGGPEWRWRKKAKGRSWVENSNEIMMYSISARWARNWSDPRSVYFVGA